jgi:hypothetical protein
MARTKAMGIGAMFLLLVAAVVILPIIVRFVTRMEPHFVVSGFKDLADAKEVSSNPVRVPANVSSNSKHVSETMNGSGQPCPEGSFFDKSSNSCMPLYPASATPDVGYYS